MRLSIFILFSLFTQILYSQSHKEGNEIVAEGYATIKVTHNVASFRISVRKSNTIQKTSIEELNKEVEKLTSILMKIGFRKDDIKISEFNIETNRYDDVAKYHASATLTLAFSLNTK